MSSRAGKRLSPRLSFIRPSFMRPSFMRSGESRISLLGCGVKCRQSPSPDEDCRAGPSPLGTLLPLVVSGEERSGCRGVTLSCWAAGVSENRCQPAPSDGAGLSPWAGAFRGVRRLDGISFRCTWLPLAFEFLSAVKRRHSWFPETELPRSDSGEIRTPDWGLAIGKRSEVAALLVAATPDLVPFETVRPGSAFIALN